MFSKHMSQRASPLPCLPAFTWQVAGVWPTKYGLLFERSTSAHEAPPGPPRYWVHSVQNVVTWASLCWFWGEIVYLRLWDDDNFHGNSTDLCHFLSSHCCTLVSSHVVLSHLTEQTHGLKITRLTSQLCHLFIFSFHICYRNASVYLLGCRFKLANVHNLCQRAQDMLGVPETVGAHQCVFTCVPSQ